MLPCYRKVVISDKQRAANQRNAQTSSGPSSAEGKAASRMNALKTGLYAKSAVIRGESKEEFDEIVRQYNDQYRPVSPQARVLVDTLIRNTWLLRRYDRIEAELWEASFGKIDGLPDGGDGLPAAMAFGMMSAGHDRLRKHADAAERAIVRTLNKLDKLTEHTESEPLPPENGFVPAFVPPLPVAPLPEPVFCQSEAPNHAGHGLDIPSSSGERCSSSS